MATIKTHTYLADESGKVWAEGQFSEAKVKSLINSYKRAGIFLTAYGSPSQLMSQIDQINEMLNANAAASALRSMGKLQVIKVGF
jgi:hypothetical protein